MAEALRAAVPRFHRSLVEALAGSPRGFSRLVAGLVDRRLGRPDHLVHDSLCSLRRLLREADEGRAIEQDLLGDLLDLAREQVSDLRGLILLQAEIPHGPQRSRSGDPA
eukprot:CAMPEP_0170607566 /NCGR_PEP_ID=MMETSP0224-20130122/21123_1 /TAXON_ID=285029 /ORGANISM="Togula jolla, Strain CCCM 725" /LENGTH=108 /DNA_ID=CAMNT_0010932741 /DNA_START=75 /DNA_END=399 /DNA_ORIENTATION=+